MNSPLFRYDPNSCAPTTLFGTVLRYMSALEPNHRNILEHELAEAETQRAKLDAAIDYLRTRLGIDASPDPGEAPTPAAATPTPRVGQAGSVADAVNPMQFYGLSVTKGAAKVLGLVGKDRPLRTREIHDALVKGGLTPKSVEVVGKMLKRDAKFHQLRRGIWGLTEWYPASVLAKGTADADLQPELGDDDSDEVSGTDEDTSNDEDEVTATTG